MNKYKNINSDNYDFLWSSGNVPYIHISFWLHEGFLKRDFLTTSDHEKHTFYISKKERGKLSEEGFELYYKHMDSYEKEIKEYLKINKKFFSALKKKDLKEFSNLELAKDFKETIKYFQKIWRPYLWTEEFCSDKVSEVIKNKDKRYNLKLLEKNIRRMSYLKFEQRKYLNQTFYPTGPMPRYYKTIENRLPNLPYKIRDCSYKEAIALLRGKIVKIPDRTFFVKGKFSKWKDVLGENARKIIKQLENYYDANTTIIKGIAGNTGHYKGIIKKIDFDLKTDFIKEIQKMKKGEILVSDTTGPEMILACKKAGAIITDEGGITSHAAFVSRELNIPSVIATKIATKVLKDGDLVEVDANKGVVKIILKAK